MPDKDGRLTQGELDALNSRLNQSVPTLSIAPVIFMLLLTSLLFWGAFVAIGWVFSSPPPTEKELELKKAHELERQIAGEHCLLAWDGSHPGFKNLVKEMLREPSSFEHVQTLAFPKDVQGMHAVIMTYRAKNGFGGVNKAVASGAFRNTDCKLELLSLD